MCDWEKPVASIRAATSIGPALSWQSNCSRAGSLSRRKNWLYSSSSWGEGMEPATAMVMLYDDKRIMHRTR